MLQLLILRLKGYIFGIHIYDNDNEYFYSARKYIKTQLHLITYKGPTPINLGFLKEPIDCIGKQTYDY